jgi:hypothetical protein
MDKIRFYEPDGVYVVTSFKILKIFNNMAPIYIVRCNKTKILTVKWRKSYSVLYKLHFVKLYINNLDSLLNI